MRAASEMVAEFHRVYGQPIRTEPAVDVPEKALRLRLIEEEWDELAEAIDYNDIVGIADALADLVYVVEGAALTFGLRVSATDVAIHMRRESIVGLKGEPWQRLRTALRQDDAYFTAVALSRILWIVEDAAVKFSIPLDACIAEVHRSNMSKLGADGRPVVRDDGKILKGPGYSPPDIAGVLRAPVVPVGGQLSFNFAAPAPVLALARDDVDRWALLHDPVDPSPLVIGLCGGAGAGKSTIASHLVEKHAARRFSLADPLKDLCRLAFDLSEPQVRGTQAEKETVDPRYGVSARWILQRVGTDGMGPDYARIGRQIECRRACRQVLPATVEWEDDDIDTAFYTGFRTFGGAGFWRDRTAERITESGALFIVIDDVRFPDEATAVLAGFDRGFDGAVVKIHPVGDSASTDPGTHASETGWLAASSTFDIVPSERGVPFLHAAIDAFLADYYGFDFPEVTP